MKNLYKVNLIQRIIVCLSFGVLIIVSMILFFNNTGLAQVDVNKQLVLIEQGNGQARIDLAKYYLNLGGIENKNKAFKLLRVISIDEQQDFLMQAYCMLDEAKKEIRNRYVLISDEQYQKAHNSVGVALKDIDINESINVLIEEAWCLSASAQIMLKVLYQYNIDGYPHYDRRILKYFEESSKEGLPQSQFFLGHIYLNGWGVEKDINKGKKLLAMSDWQKRGFTLP